MLKRIRKKILYRITLLNSVVRNRLQGPRWPWWSRVDEDLILGALPLKNLGHLEALEGMGVSGVLSIVEPFEIYSQGIFSRPIKPHEWPHGIAHKHLKIPDYSPIPLKMIQEAIQFIDELRRRGPVYVHCKAGRGRSVVVALCYLLHKHPGWNLEQALGHVKRARPHICPNQEQLQAVRAFKENVIPISRMGDI